MYLCQGPRCFDLVAFRIDKGYLGGLSRGRVSPVEGNVSPPLVLLVIVTAALSKPYKTKNTKDRKVMV